MKKKYFLVLDVETAGDVKTPLVYDIGFAVCDKKGRIFYKTSLIIQEIFIGEKEKMQTCYYAEKIPQYLIQLEKRKSFLINFYNARQLILDIMEKFDIDTVCAYNCYFDRNALNNTMSYLTGAKYRYFFPKDTKFMCIWHMCCQVIYTQKMFKNFVKRNNFISQSGNFSTTAEIGHRYYINDINFSEEHRGLQDVEIEVGLLAKCFAQHKKMNTEINRLCWRIPQESKKES